MSQGRNQTAFGRVDVRVVVLIAGLTIASLVLLAGPVRSATQNIEVGNFYYGTSDPINATVGDQLRFVVVQGNHTVRIVGLGVDSEAFNKDDPPVVVDLRPGDEGSYTIQCAIHQNHRVALEVAPPPTTTTTATTTTTTSATTTTTTTEPPGGSTTTTTTTAPPGGTTTTTSPPPGVTTTSPGGAPTTTIGGGATTTLPSDVSTTIGDRATTTAPGGFGGPAVPGAEGDTTDAGDQALGINSPAIDDAGWVRPLWWTVLGASIVGLIWVAIAWRRRPTEYD